MVKFLKSSRVASLLVIGVIGGICGLIDSFLFSIPMTVTIPVGCIAPVLVQGLICKK